MLDVPIETALTEIVFACRFSAVKVPEIAELPGVTAYGAPSASVVTVTVEDISEEPELEG